MRKLIAGLTLLLGMNCLAATTYTHTDGNLRWSFTLSGTPSKATLTAVQTVSGDLTGAITTPATVKKDGVEGDATYPVTAIAANSFQSLAITGLTIGDSVTTIGAGAFAGCMELVSVNMGNGVETIASPNYNANVNAGEQQFVYGAFGNCILLETVTFSPVLRTLGGYAFSGCDALQSVELPNSLETIGVGCFMKSESLSSVEFGTGLLSIGAASFYGCPELQSVKFAANETPLLTIGENAFAQAVKLVTLEFSNSLKQINKGAFAGCLALETLVLPDSLKSMGAAAFNGCTSLKSVDMGNGVETIESANYSGTYGDKPNGCDYGAFGCCENLETVTFSDSLITLGNYAFSRCFALKSVELPDSLQTMGADCFYNNTSLGTVKIGTDLRSIGDYSFYNCPELQAVEFKANDTPLLTIGECAFAYAVKLTTLTFSNSLKQIGVGAFRGCTSLAELTLPDSLTYIGSAAFNGCTSLKSVDMGNGVETIGSANYSGTYGDKPNGCDYGAFGCCENLETVAFSDALIFLGNYAFSRCFALKSVELPDSLQTMGPDCFYNNTSLGSVKIGTDLRSIGDYSFYNCPELQAVEFKANDTPLLTIGECAFAYAVKLTTLTFSNSLKQIGVGAFRGCTSLAELTLPDSLTYIGSAAFNGCTSLKSVDMGNGVVEIGAANYSGTYGDKPNGCKYGAFGYCEQLETVSFSASLATLGGYAFSECYALKSVTLPESLISIGVDCFYHNKDLTSVSFGRRIEYIGQYSFYDCPALRYVTFAETTTPLLTIARGAFANDISLSTVELSGGLKTVESGAFANDPLLRKLTIPAIVTEFGNGVFSGMGDLRQVTFAGLPPKNIANAGLAKDVEIRYSEEWAEDWAPIIESCGFTNTTSYDPSVKPPFDPVITGDVKLTVSNIVVHYVTQSIPSDAVIPPTSAGIVNVITEVNAGNAIAITADWAKQYPGFENLYGEDFGKAVTAETGKRDGAGNPMFVWQDFVAGTDPTKPEDTFKASITFDKDTGKPVISWTPELSEAEAAKREYKVFGKAKINDKDWTLVDGDAEDFNFFKVSVGMKP